MILHVNLLRPIQCVRLVVVLNAQTRKGRRQQDVDSKSTVSGVRLDWAQTVALALPSHEVPLNK